MNTAGGRLRRLLFLGSLVPEDISNSNPYSSAAANSFQLNLLTGLMSYGLDQVEILSLYPLAAYPRCKHRRWPLSQHTLFGHSRLTVVGFSNLGPLKPFSQLLSIMNQVFRIWLRKSFNPDIVLTYNAPQRIAVPAILAGKLFRIPVVFIAADVQPIEPWSYRIIDMVARLRAYWIRGCDGIIALSTKVTDDFCKGKPTIRMEGGVDKGDFEPPSEEAANNAGRKDDSYSILYAGTLVESSGVRLLLAAFENIRDERYRLDFTGRGPMEKEINAASASDSRIRLYGWLDRSAYMDLMKSATVLVNPRLTSFPENRYNFPAKLLEYLASGRPVISTSTADLQKEYGDLVFIMEEETPEALAQLIQEVCALDPDDLQEFGARAREYVLSNKTWDVQARRVRDFLEQVIEEKGRHRS